VPVSKAQLNHTIDSTMLYPMLTENEEIESASFQIPALVSYYTTPLHPISFFLFK